MNLTIKEYKNLLTALFGYLSYYDLVLSAIKTKIYIKHLKKGRKEYVDLAKKLDDYIKKKEVQK